MMSTSTLWTIVVLHWSILVTPGPNMLLVAQLAASGQRRTALYAGLGITAVAGIWALLAALGLHAVFSAHAGIRRVAQLAGGCYLLLLALRMWRSGAAPARLQAGAATALSGFKLGFVTNILNPKSALFFASVFATALPASFPQALLWSALAAVVVNSLTWHTFLAVTFSRPWMLGAYARQRSQLSRLASLLAAGFGIRLLWQTWRESARAAGTSTQ